MATYRTAFAGAWMVLAMLTASACQQLNEAINSRDLECTDAPDDICVRLADDIVGLWDARGVARDGPIERVLVNPVDCSVIKRPNPAMARCWEAAGTIAGSGGGSIGTYYVERVDGTLTDDEGRVIGN